MSKEPPYAPQHAALRCVGALHRGIDVLTSPPIAEDVHRSGQRCVCARGLLQLTLSPRGGLRGGRLLAVEEHPRTAAAAQALGLGGARSALGLRRDVDVLTSPPIAATAPLEDLHLEPVLPQQQQQRHDGGEAAWAAQALRLGGDWSALGPRRDVDAFTSPPIPAGSVAVPLPTSSSSDADAAPSTPSAAERPPQSGNCDVVVVQAVAVAMVRVDATPAPPADSSLVAPLSGRGVNHFLEPSSWKVRVYFYFLLYLMTRIYTNLMLYLMDFIWFLAHLPHHTCVHTPHTSQIEILVADAALVLNGVADDARLGCIDAARIDCAANCRAHRGWPHAAPNHAALPDCGAFHINPCIPLRIRVVGGCLPTRGLDPDDINVSSLR